MSKSNNKKICIVAQSLSKGGAERSSALLSKMLFSLGYDVHIVTVLSGVDYEYSGTHFNLGELKDKRDTFFGRLHRLQVFKKYLKTHQFDVIIDNRSRVQAFTEFIITTLIYKIPTVYVIHNFETSKSFTKYAWLNTLLYKNKMMTCVSSEAKMKFETQFKLNRIKVIYNGFDFKTIALQSQEQIADQIADYIIYYGRIDDDHKNLILLLEAYKQSKLIAQKIRLLILGDGPDIQSIENYSKQLQINDNVVFKGFTSNPYPYVKNAKFTLLTSRHEGFPMVIPESLSLEVPVISVDCKSGPSEVITNGFNGLLVENYNAKALADAMNSFIFDLDLYTKCKSNAKKSVEQFSVEYISKDWQNVINTLDETSKTNF